MKGLHLIGDFHRCALPPDGLSDAGALESFCVEACMRAGLTPVGRLFHRFLDEIGAPAGVTGTVVLAESHLCLHTWPESASVTLDLYVCNFSADNRDRARQVFAALRAHFSPSEAVCHEVERGALPESPSRSARG